MKLAIATDGDSVSEHFGHCRMYTLYTIDNGSITLREELMSPGHEPGVLPSFLAGHKVTHVIAGGMGPRAVDLFCENNIEVFLGISGKVDETAQAFLAGRITPGQSSCTHHEGDHECSH